jgi:hypothetical protein
MPAKITIQSMPPVSTALAKCANRLDMPGLLSGILAGLPGMLIFLHFFMMLAAEICCLPAV